MIISVTRLQFPSLGMLLPFIVYSFEPQTQVKRSPSDTATAAMRDQHGGCRTRPVWRDVESMRAFMASGAHRQAMPKLLDWCDEAALVHWEQDTPTLPEWDEAHRRLVTQGRR